MTVHLVRLCVGVEKLDRLRKGQAKQLKKYGSVFFVTRMMPKRGAELCDGGSLYWIIKGKICVRQTILDLEAVQGADGIKRCRMGLSPELVVTRPQPRRPFQGWRYLSVEDAPPDLPKSYGDNADMPEALRDELSALGLL